MEAMVRVWVAGVLIGDGDVGELGRIRCSFACCVEVGKGSLTAVSGVVVEKELCRTIRRIGNGEVVGFCFRNREIAAVVWIITAVDSQVEAAIALRA